MRAQKIHDVVFGNLAQYTSWAAMYISFTQVTILPYEYSTILSCSWRNTCSSDLGIFCM